MTLEDLLEMSDELPRKLTELKDYKLVIVENNEYGSFVHIPVKYARINTATREILLED